MDAQSIGVYCRDIEAYLTRKNDGHLIRIVGPSFELVSGWARSGIPLKIACSGIDRCFERYYRKGPRRRPVKIDFCEADVLDAFDAWRRAVGLTFANGDADGSADRALPGEAPRERRGRSLPAHLERVLMRLTDARTKGSLGEGANTVLDRVSAELDSAKRTARGLRGDARAGAIGRLAELDAELLAMARADLSIDERDALDREAAADLESFRERMHPDAYRSACRGAADRLLRDRLGLPTVSF